MTDLATRPRPAPPGRVRRAVGGVRHTAKDWLDRPMTSWHLILAIFALLLGFGLLMVLSSSSIVSFRSRSGSAFSTFENQAVYALVGLGGFVFAARVSPMLIRRLSFPAVLVSLVMLAAVLGIGHKYNGARSWLGVGTITFQPSELAKVALLIWMGHVLAARRRELRSLKALLIPALPIFLLMVGLIMLQPDLGTTVSLTIVFFAVLWFAGAPAWIFGVLAAGGLAGMVYLATSAGYRSMRVLAFLHPTDPAYKEWTYQLNQGLYAMGHGGLFGAGLGQSVAKWSWLPNADSDFIFAIIGEELGLIGTGLVLLLFGLLAYTGLRIARRNVDPFIKIVAASCTVWLVGQAAINIGYVVGLLPVTGIPLPMISAGGTSLVVSMLVFGLLANFARREPQAAAALYSQGPGRIARFLGVGSRPPGVAKPAKPPRKRAARSGPGGKPGRRTRGDKPVKPARSAKSVKPVKPAKATKLAKPAKSGGSRPAGSTRRIVSASSTIPLASSDTRSRSGRSSLPSAAHPERRPAAAPGPRTPGRRPSEGWPADTSTPEYGGAEYGPTRPGYRFQAAQPGARSQPAASRRTDQDGRTVRR